MKIRIALVSLLGAAALPAMADHGSALVAGEIGFVPHPPVSTLTRTQVLDDYVLWHRNASTEGSAPQLRGEFGWRPAALASTMSRQQVLTELARWRANPVTDDGWRQVSGEIGWVYAGDRAESAKLRPMGGSTAAVPRR